MRMRSLHAPVRPRSSLPRLARWAALPCLVVGCSGEGLRPAADDDVVERFTWHYVESNPERVFAPTFLGVPTWQNPCDLWVMQEIVTEVRPQVIVETGTAHGGSALYYASLLAQLDPDARVVTVDVEGHHRPAFDLPLWRERVEFVHGDATDPAVVERVAARVRGKRVAVTLDSMHGQSFVRREMELWAPLVTPGSYLVVQDTVIDRHPEWIARYTSESAGPAPAVDAFLATHPEFDRDRGREQRFLLTFHPDGWLRRKG